MLCLFKGVKWFQEGGRRDEDIPCLVKIDMRAVVIEVGRGVAEKESGSRFSSSVLILLTIRGQRTQQLVLSCSQSG